MKYALLIYENEANYGADRGGAATMARHIAFAQDIGARRLAGEGLQDSATATTLRFDGDKTAMHDGPFAEAREQLGGFYLIEAADLDEAIAIAKKVPLVSNGAIEVRPLMHQG